MLDGIKEMTWVRRAGQEHIGRYHYQVARLLEPDDKSSFGAVVIQVEIHALAGRSAGA